MLDIFMYDTNSYPISLQDSSYLQAKGKNHVDPDQMSF